MVDWFLEFSGIRERWERARRRASERVLVDGQSTVTVVPAQRQSAIPDQDFEKV